MFVLALILVLASSFGETCSSKVTEATCSDGCKWTNGTGTCGGDSGTCGGTPACTGLAEASCSSSTGCTWVAAIDASCGGSATCASQPNENTCTSLAGGCEWTTAGTAFCTGTRACSGNTDAYCNLGGCSWAEATSSACTGAEYLFCSAATTVSSCGALDYCEWTLHEPRGCISDLPSDLTCDAFNDDEFGDFGEIYCSLTPGCTGGSIGTCGGTTTKRCSDLGLDKCFTSFCDFVGLGQCVSTCSYYDGQEGQCNADSGCSYNNGSNTCIGTASCSDYTQEQCWNHSNCQFNNELKCVVPSKCDDLSGESSCTNAGCTWASGEGTCSGTVDISEATCSAVIDPSWSQCAAAGCTGENIYECAGEIGDCSAWKFGGPTCTTLGCTSTGYVPGTCAGTINFDAGASATTKAACDDLGEFFHWNENAVAYCNAKDDSYTPKPCREFSSGEEICSGLSDCTWQAATPAGCTGTPIGSECASLTTSGQGTCTGNQCIWVPAGTFSCTGSTTGSCSGKTEAVCGTITGCSYTAATAASCTGNPVGTCTGDSTNCGNVNGCAWTSGVCSTLSTQGACEGNSACSWNQPGTCAESEGGEGEGGAAYSVYAPALLVLVLFALLL